MPNSGNFSTSFWYSDDGLPHNSVASIAQTPDGYLWFGTWNGVARFNGRNFKIFNTERTPGFSNSGIRSMAIGVDQALWLATSRGGLMRLANQRWSHISEADGLPSDALMSLHVLKQGDVWVGTQGSGLAILDKSGRIKATLKTSDGLGGAWVQGLFEDVDGSVWIATTRGLKWYRDGKIENFGDAHGLPPDGSVYAVLRDRQGVLWAGSESGLYRLNSSAEVANPRFSRVLPELQGAVQCLLEDQAGQLWVGTQSSGLLRIADDHVDYFNTENGLTNNRVLSLYQDHEGSMWVGTNAGLVRLSASGFTRVNRMNRLSDEFVRSAALGLAPGVMWIGTSKGLNRIEQGVVTQLVGTPVERVSVMTVLEARDGSLWVGTYDQGVWLREGQVWRHLTREAKHLPHNQVRTLSQTSNGIVWVGTAQGLVQFQQQGLSWAVADQFGASAGFKSIYILSMLESRDSQLWVGTGNGVSVIPKAGADGHVDQTKIRVYSRENGFPGNDVFDIYQDAAGVLWFATSSGLVRLLDGRFDRIGRAAGLPEETIFGLAEDGAGNFWLTSNDGLLQVTRAQIHGFLAKQQLIKPRRFDRQDGMSAAQINGSSDPSISVDASGKFWLPTARGVTIMDPALVNARKLGEVPVAFEAVTINREPHALTSAVNAKSGPNRLDFEFAGLSFLASDRLQYRYKLNGYDKDWNDNGASTHALFANLPPGAYTLEVQAANLEGEFGPSAKLDLLIQARLLETWWFKPLLALLLGLGVFGVLRLKLMQQRRYQRQLEADVASRTRELNERNDALATSDVEKTALLRTIKMQSEAFARQAREDHLTGIANRRYFDLRAAAAFANARQGGRNLVVGIVDIDHFKSVNDTYSHDIGDQVLKATAQIIANLVGADGLGARFGGEEFGVYFDQLSLQDATQRMEAIRAAIAKMQLEEAPQLRVSISAGLTDAPSATSYERSMARADALLYQAKHAGRNRVVVEVSGN